MARIIQLDHMLTRIIVNIVKKLRLKMTVMDLIAKLQKSPGNASVCYMYDGVETLSVDAIWLAVNGEVVMAEKGSSVYQTENRPCTAPDAYKKIHWHVGD